MSVLASDQNDLIDSYLGHFIECQGARSNHIKGTGNEIFKSFDEKPLPIALEKLLDSIVLDAYCEHIHHLNAQEFTSFLEFIHKAADLNKETNQHMGYQLPDGTYGIQYTFSPHLLTWMIQQPEAKELTQDRVYLLHFLLAVIQLNFLIPFIQTKPIEEIDINQILDLQKTYEAALSLKAQEDLMQGFSGHVTPEELQKIIDENNKKRAEKGGKAKAEKEYGEAKQYVRERIPALKERGLNGRQITEILEKQLREEIGKSLDAECPVFQTLYGWVLRANRGQDF